MKKIIGVVVSVFVWVFLPTASALAQEGGFNQRDQQFEQEVYTRLEAVNAEAVPVFKAATEALDAEDYIQARADYEQVLEMAPDFPDVLRRLSYVEAALGNLDIAEQYARKAYQISPTHENKVGLANVLIEFQDASRQNEAFLLAQEAVEEAPDDFQAFVTLMWTAANIGDMETLRTTSNQVIELAPDYPTAHYFAGLVAAEDGKWEKAEKELLLAKQYGIPADIVDQAIEETGISTQAAVFRGLRLGGYGLAGWLVAFGLLFLAGQLLSRLTLKAVDHAIQSGAFEIDRGERLVRRFYGVVISLASLYFYISIPILILVVLAIVGGLIYLFFTIGRIPVKLAIMLLIGGVFTLVAIVRSVFARVRLGEPGRKVASNEFPELWQMVSRVAQKVGTRPVDAIYLTPGVEVAVTERGSLAKKLRDQGERVLILGLGALSGLTQGQLQSILAHEYGHFNNRDTAGGNLARQVDYSVYMMAYGLATAGQARWFNPVWLFVNGYHRTFARITLGASRLQEILADRIAVLAYGARDMADGLKHIIRKGFEFDAQVNAEIDQARSQQRVLNNLYTLPPVSDPGSLEQQLNEAMSRPSSAYDSHPAPRDRLALIERIRTGGFFGSDPRPAWDLIPNAAQLQEEMTMAITDQLRRSNQLPEAQEQTT